MLPFASINLALFREYDITKRRVQKIIKAGATVVLTTGGIDDFTLKEFVESGVMAVRRVKKEDLKRIAKATGGMCIAWAIYSLMAMLILFSYGHRIACQLGRGGDIRRVVAWLGWGGGAGENLGRRAHLHQGTQGSYCCFDHLAWSQ
jgi:TCP-1/cpn60 chaperonin family